MKKIQIPIHPLAKLRKEKDISTEKFIKIVFEKTNDNSARSYLSQIENFKRKFPKKKEILLKKLGFSNQEIDEVMKAQVLSKRVDMEHLEITDKELLTLSKMTTALGGTVSLEKAINLLMVMKK